MDQNSSMYNIGQTLLRAREQKNWSVEQAAKTLNMPVNTIKVLEQNDFSAIPQLAFLKGYLRSYAKLLDLDADQIMQRFAEEYQQDASNHKNNLISPAVQSIRVPVKSGHRPQTTMPSIIKKASFFLALAAILYLAYHYLASPSAPQANPTNPLDTSNPTNTSKSWFQQLKSALPFSSSNTPSEQVVTDSTEEATTAPTKVSKEDALSTNDSAKDTKRVASSSDKTTTVKASEDKTGPLLVTPNATPTTEVQRVDLFTPNNGGYAEPALDKLNLQFTGPAQVTIKDAEGQTLYSGKKQPDAPLNLKGIAPFGIKIKGTPNVQIKLNDQPVDLNLYSVNGKADFRLSH